MITLDEFVKIETRFMVYYDNKEIFTSTDSDLVPILKFLDTNHTNGNEVVIFDKYIGRAAALLMSFIKPDVVYTPLISESAVDVFVEQEIDFEALEMIPYLMGRASEGMCQWEILAKDKNPQEFLKLVKEKLTC